ncbi:MAG: hypothetical protein ACPGVU_12635, partial [Limisphaerales bacterium]
NVKAAEISVNAGRTWNRVEQNDLTDHVKGRSQYWLRFAAPPTDLEIRTVCQANVAVLPRLKDNGTTIDYEASGRSVLSLGPELDLAQTFVSAGKFGEKSVTLKVVPDQPVLGLYAAAHIASGSPPNPKFKYQIDFSLNGGVSWQPLVKDWQIPRRGDEPKDYWSQSFCYGSAELAAAADESISIRFRNDGGRRYLRAEAHLVQDTGRNDPLKVTYRWSDHGGDHQSSHVFRSRGDWTLATGRNVRTRWVEFEPVP